MPDEKNLFDTWKATLTRRYGNSHNEDFVQEAHENLLDVYRNFTSSDCVDPHFISEICSSDFNKSTQRLGEMLLYEKLSHVGLTPTSKSEGPDFRVEINGQPIWLELVTPSIGEDSRISHLVTSYSPLSPCPIQGRELSERHLLRVSSSISEKLVKFEKYLKKGIVAAEDPLIIVVNDALLCPDFFQYGVSHNADVGVGGLSLAEHAVNGVGPSFWVPREGKGKEQYVLNPTFRDNVQNRPEPSKNGGTRGPVPVSLFKNPAEPEAQAIAKRATILSAVFQLTLREDYGIFMLIRKKTETEDRLGETLLTKGILVKNQNSKNTLTAEASEILTKIVVAPALSPREIWDIHNRQMKFFLGENYKEKPFPI